MDMNKLTSFVSRGLFGSALALLALAFAERVAFSFGYTITSGAFSGGRLLDIVAVLVIVVIALQLREIRQELRHRTG